MARNDEAEATIRILGEDLVSGVAAKAERNVEKVGDAADKAKGPFGRLKDKMDEMGKSTVFTELNNAMELAGKVGAAAGQIWDSLKQAASDRVVHNAFGKAFGDAAGSLGALRAAAGELIADQSLREIGNQGARAGLTLDQVAQLLETSTKAALSTGKDATEQAKAFLKSVVEGNDEATKQNGVIVNLAAGQAEYAQKLGITADKMTAAQKTAANLAEFTRQTNAAMGDVGDDETISRLGRLEKKWENLSAQIREVALGLTVGLPESIQAAEDAIAAFAKSSADKTNDMITKGDYSKENIDRIVTRLRMRGEAQAAYHMQLELTARAAEILAGEEAALDKIYADHAMQLAAVARAQTVRITGLQDEVRKSEEAKRAAAIHAQELALVALQMGHSVQAAERYKAALDLTAAAHMPVTDHVNLLYAATRASNNELARSIELQAEMASLAGDPATAAALRAQLQGVLTGETGSTKPDGARGGGGGPKKSALDASLEANAKATEAGQQKLVDNMWAMREEAERALADQHERALADDQARLMERTQLLVQQYEEQQAMLISSRQQGFNSLSDSILRLRDAFGELDGISLDGLANAAQGMGPLLEQFRGLEEAGKKGSGVMAASVGGIIMASGKLTAGLIKDQRAQAIIMSLVETAAGFASLAVPDPYGAAMHFVSAGLYAAVAGAGKSGGGGGGGGGSSRGASGGRGDVGRVPNDQPPAGPSFAPVTIHVSGTFLGSDADRTGRELARMVDRHRGRSFRGSDAGNPP